MATTIATAGPIARATPPGVRWRWLKGMYAFDIVGAGIPGLLALAAPAWAGENLFGAAGDPVALRMVGAVWLAVAGASALALRRPLRFAPLLPVQMAYKALWLATTVPTLARGERPELWPLALLFALWVVGDAIATPWALLFGQDATDRRA